MMTLGERYVTQWSSEPGKMFFAHYAIAGSIATFVLAFFLSKTIWWSVIFSVHVVLIILHLIVGLYIDIRLEEAA